MENNISPTMTPLERAIDAVGSVKTWDGDTIGQNLTTEEIANAVRAVLLAIREPSEGMIEAGSAGGDWPWSKGTFQDMIDKALEEG